MCSEKRQKANITHKSALKDYIRTSPTYFSRMFLLLFSNRPYPNVKIIVA